jgi:uncharacterized protein (TIGR02246 family)
MDLRICIAAAALIAGAPVVLGQSTEKQNNQDTSTSSTWTYDSKTGQINGAASGAKRKAAQEIVALELSQMTAWNNHDLQGVLAAYWQSADLISIAGEEPEVHGFQALQKALTTIYADPNTMGSLVLDTLRVQVISDDTASCVASYVVHTAQNVYYCDDTATLRHLPEGWRIAFEHATVATH